jgi:hypothetical protein
MQTLGKGNLELDSHIALLMLYLAECLRQQLIVK